MHLTGDYLSHGSDFSSSKWLCMTELLVEMIENDLKSENRTAIFQALHHLQVFNAQDSQFQVGAPRTPKQHVSLLAADPPTPPPLD